MTKPLPAVGTTVRRKRRVAPAVATLAVLAAAYWAFLEIRLRAGVTDWLAQARAAGLTIQTEAPRYATLGARPATALGAARLTLDGMTLATPSLVAAIDPLDPRGLLIDAEQPTATGPGGAAHAVHLRTRLRLGDPTNSETQLDHATLAARGPWDVTFATAPTASGIAWALTTAGAPALIATGQATATTLTVEDAHPTGDDTTHAAGQLTLDATRHPAGTVTLRTRDPASALALLSPFLTPDNNRTLGALLRVAGTFASGDVTIPVALQRNLVSVMGVPVARVTLPAFDWPLPR